MMKRIIDFILITAMVLSLVPVLNVDASNNKNIDFGNPIQVNVYEDENGIEVTEKIYFVPSSTSVKRDTSGAGWYKNEKQYVWNKNSDNEKTMTYYAQGYFVWGNGDVTVSNISGNVSGVPSGITTSNFSTTSGTGRYAYFFNKYAYVTFSFTATNFVGMSQNFSVTMRVSESGNNI